MSNEPTQSGADEVDRDLDLLAVARLGFKERLERVRPDDWARPTPCTEWNVRQLVNHVVGSDLRYSYLLKGGNAEDYKRRREEEVGSGPVLSHDPVEDWMRAGAVFDAAVREPGAMERIVDYPRGPLRGRDLVVGRVLDITIHTWDLARSIDADERLNERLVRRCLSADIFQRRVGHDGDGDGMGGSLSATQLQDRLLRASGRSPS